MDTRPVRKNQTTFHEKRNTKSPKIQLQYSGGWYLARYFGNAGKVFGPTPEAAILRLRTGK